MNDVLVMVGCGIVLCSVVAFFFVMNSVYGGAAVDLKNARVGDVYNFEYLQPVTGDSKRFLAKVVDVWSLSNESIQRLNHNSKYRRYDPEFKRTNHLVTCETPDGKVRNFYAERVVNCRRPLLAKALFGTRFAAALI